MYVHMLSTYMYFIFYALFVDQVTEKLTIKQHLVEELRKQLLSQDSQDTSHKDGLPELMCEMTERLEKLSKQ